MALHVLVTGGYLEAGWSVTATCRSPHESDALKALDARVEQLDMRETSSFPRFAERLAGAPIDLLVNNAGVYGARGPAQVLPTLDVPSWLDTVLVNAIAPIKLTEFVMFRLGDGVEKEETDFAAEVAAAAGTK